MMKRSIVALCALALVLVACGNDKGTTQTNASSVAVSLQEWSVLPSPGSVAAGKVTFNVSNKGKHEHEFVVIKTDLDLTALPVSADGSINEDGTGFTAVGEIEDIAAGANPSTSFTLAAGKYVLFCNIVEDEALPDMAGTKSHYKLGMRTGFTVT